MARETSTGKLTDALDGLTVEGMGNVVATASDRLTSFPDAELGVLESFVKEMPLPQRFSPETRVGEFFPDGTRRNPFFVGRTEAEVRRLEVRMRVDSLRLRLASLGREYEELLTELLADVLEARGESMQEPSEDMREPHIAGAQQSREVYYHDLLEMNPEDVVQGSVFSGTQSESSGLFLNSIVEVLKDPDWLLVAPGSAEYLARKEAGLPVSQHLDANQIDALKIAIDGGDLKGLASRINNVVTGNLLFNTHDVIARAYEVLARQYPDLTIFSAAQFYYFKLLDSATVGYLPNLLELNDQTYTRLVYPVISMIKLSDFVKAYTTGKVRSFRPNHYRWWAGNLSMSLSEDALAEYLVVRRIPYEQDKRRALQKVFQERGIRVGSI